MKIVIVYYSRSGQTRKIAELIGSKLNAEIEEIHDHKSRKGIFGFITSGNEAYLRKMPAIDPPKKDPAQYDMVIIGTPIWAGNPSTPVRAFLKENQEKLKQVAFFCTSMGSNPKPAFEEMRKIIGQEPIEQMNVTTRDFRNQFYPEMVDEFVQRIKQSEKDSGKGNDE